MSFLTSSILGLILGTQGTIGLKYGVGILQTGKESQYVAVSYQSQIYKGISNTLEVCGYVDQQRGRAPAMCASYSLGIRVLKPNYYLESMHGLGFINSTDVLLGGRFQFFQELGVGIRDKDGYSIGAHVKHISSAGIHNPNIGRNYIGIKLGFPLGY